MAWATFKDAVTGQTFTIYSGEIITVYDANGWSIQLKYTPSVAGAPWQPVPGSVRDKNGNKVNMVNNVPTTPIPSGGAADGTPVNVAAGSTWNPVYVTPWNDSLPQGTITVGDPIEAGGGNSQEAMYQAD